MNANARGSVLVITLFIILVISVIVGVISAIIVNDLRASRDYRQATINHDGAETGVERALYYIQRARLAKTVGAVETATMLNGVSGTLTNGVPYQLTVSANNTIVTDHLEQGETSQYDIFDEQYSPTFKIIPLAGLAGLHFMWSDQCSTGSGPGQLEVSLYQWEQTLWTDLSDPSAVQTHYVVNCVPGPSSPCDYRLGLDSTHLYRVRVKALQCDANNFAMTAYSSTDTNLTMHNVFEIGSLSVYRGTGQYSMATTLWHPPVNNYLDYVLFSEETITK